MMNRNRGAESDTGQASVMVLYGDKTGSRRRLFGWGLPIFLAIIAVILLSTRNSAEPVEYQTRNVSRGNLIMKVSATGNLEPTNQVDVGSELSGIIDSVEVDFNDTVKVGQVLARLDTDKLEADVKKSGAALESARAQVLQTQATLKETQAEYKRLKQVYELSGGKVPSAYDLEAAEAAYEKARADVSGANAQVTQAKAVLESAEADLGKALIRSPINGVVLSRDVEPGQTVAASLQAPVLFTLAEDLARMELHVDVDEADVGQVRKGQDATFTVDAYPERIFPAHINQVRYGASDTDGVITYETVLSLDNKDLLLMPGMTATADIIVSRVDNAILVPNAALRFTPQEDNPGNEEQAGSDSMVSKILPRPPRHKKTSTGNNSESAPGAQKQVWSLRNGDLVSVPVTTGMSDGIMTEITGGDLETGMKLVVGIKSAKK